MHDIGMPGDRLLHTIIVSQEQPDEKGGLAGRREVEGMTPPTEICDSVDLLASRLLVRHEELSHKLFLVMQPPKFSWKGSLDVSSIREAMSAIARKHLR